MTLGFIRSLPDHLNWRGFCFLIAILMLCHKSIAKFTFLWDFNTHLPLTRRAPSFALVSIITLCDMCHVPVSFCAMHIKTEPSGSFSAPWPLCSGVCQNLYVLVTVESGVWLNHLKCVSSQTSRSVFATQDAVPVVISRLPTYLDMSENFTVFWKSEESMEFPHAKHFWS